MHHEHWVLYNTVNARFLSVRRLGGTIYDPGSLLSDTFFLPSMRLVWTPEPKNVKISYHEHFETRPKFAFHIDFSDHVTDTFNVSTVRFEHMGRIIDGRRNRLGSLCNLICVGTRNRQLNFRNTMTWMEMVAFYRSENNGI